MKKKLLRYILAGTLCASLIGGTVYAEGSGGRSAGIQSSGILHIQNGDDESEYVHIDAEDLIRLADQVDILEETYKLYIEDIIKKQYPGGLVDRQFHKHTGGSGKDPIPDGDVYYSVNDPGGCYRSAGHTHNEGGLSCPGEWKTNCPYSGKPCDNHQGSYSCPEHGSSKTTVVRMEGGYTNYWCNGTVDPYFVSQCTSSQNNTWKVNCGKSTSTIEKITITYP